MACSLIDRASFIASREEFVSFIKDLKEDTTEPRPFVLALRSAGYQLMMSIQHPVLMERLLQQFHLKDYAGLLSLPGTKVSADFICFKLSEVGTHSHFHLELFAGLYSNWIYYGSGPFTGQDTESFKPYAKPASGGGPKPTFINIGDRVFAFATVTGGVEASTEMSFDLIAKGKIVHILSGRHGANMLGQLVTDEGVVDDELLEEDHFFKADLPMFSTNMGNEMRDGRLFIEHLENKAGALQRSRIQEILAMGEEHVIILNWCVSILSINEFTVPSLLEDPMRTSAAYFGPLRDAQERWIEYLNLK